MNTVSSAAQYASGLHWVQHELEQALLRVRTLIEQYMEAPEQVLPLQQAVVELHQVRGTATMIRSLAVATMADEMKQALQDLLQDRIGEKEAAFAALLGATIQLGDYIDALAGGMDDSVLVFQSAINELRLARGKTVLSQAELFAQHMAGLDFAIALPPSDTRLPGASQEVARKYLLGFQQGLLHWLKGQEPQLALGRMGKVAELVAASTEQVPVYQLWRAIAASIEALLTHALDESMDLKRLFGRAGAQLKLLAEEGEARASGEAAALAFQFLFHIGRSRGEGPRVTSLRKTYDLHAHLPSVTVLEELQRRTRGPNTILLNRLSEEIRNDLGQVKDRIDLVVRAGSKAGTDLSDTIATLRRIGVTLNMLGLAVLERVVAAQARALEDLKPSDSGARDPAWLEVATALLRVEHGLDEALFRQLRQPGQTEPSPFEATEGVPHQRDVREGTEALLRELLVDVAKLKPAVDQFIRSGDVSGLSEASRLIGDVQSGLRILGYDQAAETTVQLGQFVRSRAFVDMRQDPSRADRFAEAVACIEYFLEAVQKHEPHPERLIERFVEYVSRLEVPADVPVHDTGMFKTGEEPTTDLLVTETPAPTAVPIAPPADEVDPEIREIFVEEAGEVRALLEQRLPAFRRTPDEREVLGEVRRAFHTLKGSGRMVGATHIGNFGWAIEHLLNRCIEGAIALSPPVVEVVEQAIGLLPELIDGFREGRTAPEALAALIARGERLAKGESESGPSPEILNVFREDARERLAIIQGWLDRQDRTRTAYPVDAEVVRAFHTLRGSAALVDASAVSGLAGALEQYQDSLRSAAMQLPADGFHLVLEAAAQLNDWVAKVGEGGTQPDIAGWLERIDRMQAIVPTSAVLAAEDRQRADDFANETFGLLQQAEQALKAWGAQPDASYNARVLKGIFETLHGAAVNARCNPLARLSEAFAQRFGSCIGGPAPGTAFFRQVAALVESTYQQLDAFREGSLGEEDAALVAQILALDAAADEAATPLAASEPPSSAPSPGLEPPALRTAVDMEAEAVAPEVIEIPPVVEEPLTVMQPGADPELLALFIGEAEELLEAIDRHFAAWERNAADTSIVAELARALHTLKGSARMAGADDVGEVAHRLETLLEQLQSGHIPRSAELFGRVHNVVDGLHGLLAEIKAGHTPAADPLLAELEDVAEAAAAAAARELAEVDRHAGVFEAEPRAGVVRIDEAQLDEVIEIPPVADEGTQAGASDEAGFDAELAEVFAGEAAELLEALETNLQAWRADVSAAAPLREVQRALHTLKGGARMAGLERMGEAAHEMESQVERMERGQAVADEPAFAELQRALEQLQGMHDMLQRGDAARLAQHQGPPPVGTPLTVPALPPAPPATLQVEHFTEPEPPPVRPSGGGWDPLLFWKPEDEDAELIALRRETARVAVEQLDGMLNQAGEISIYRSRLEQHNSAVQFQLDEMQQTIGRTRELLRSLEVETEAQIAARGVVHNAEGDQYGGEFDPLEMDRYTRMQELTRAISESLADMSSIHGSMDGQTSEAETLLMQQGRITTQIQQGLMSTLMVPFSRQLQRLQRVVRQVAQETGKQADIEFEGVEAEMDRNVLERMTAPLEHLLRNAVVHGLETPADREAAGKPATGRILVILKREGTQLALEVRDDGRGLDYQAIRATAVRRGLLKADAELSEEAIGQFIFEPGFSTARELTQSAGRGVGMDVVASEVKQLGGTLGLASEAGKGTRFLIRLPLSLAISQALLIGVGHEMYALPLATIAGISRIETSRLAEYYAVDGPLLSYGGEDYRVAYLGDFLDAGRPEKEEARSKSVIMVRMGDTLGGGVRRIAVVVDALYGNREVVSKGAGPQVSAVPGVTGATILPDGRVVLILDVPALAQDRARKEAALEVAAAAPVRIDSEADLRKMVMVVDDSITIRRVTERLLDKAGFRVVTAKDGLDAIALLQTETPAAMLLDIEMPRADGFEVATFVRNSERLRGLPIIMITSRSGEKHRERARQIGVDRYMIKPYQEEQLLGELRTVLGGA